MATVRFIVKTTLGDSTTHTLELTEESGAATFGTKMNEIASALAGTIPWILFLEPFVFYRSDCIAYVTIEVEGPESVKEDVIRTGFPTPVNRPEL